MPSRLWGGCAVALLAALTMAESAVAQLKVAVMPSFNQNQTYGNAELGEPIAVWGRAWGGTAPYTYTLDAGDGAGPSASAAVADPKFIGGDVTYASTGTKTMTLTVTDANNDSVSRSAAIRVFLNPDHDVETNIAIEHGLLYLYKVHVRSGSQVYWNLVSSNSAEYQLGTVGFATLAFEENGHKPGNDFEEDIYAEMVDGGINRILELSSARTTHGTSSFQDHSDGIAVRNVDYLNGNGFGAHLWAGGHATYVNGICGLALALSRDSAADAQAAMIGAGPFAGLSVYTVMQDLTEQLSFAQGDGTSRGGWVYSVTTANSGRDASTQQWPCLFFRGAIDVHGIEPAQWVKDNIDVGFQALQNANGGLGYRNNSSWINSGKTGGALVGWSVAGKDDTHPPVQNAIGYLGDHWFDQGGWNPAQGWAGYFYASYAVKKGLALMDQETIATAQGARNWYDDQCAWLLGKTPDAVHGTINPTRRNLSYSFGQNTDGRWDGAEIFDNRGPALGTANAILILTKGVTVPLPVALINDFTGGTGEALAGVNISVNGGPSFHQGAPDFVINQYQWILRDDDGAGNPVGALDWNSPDYTGVNIVLDRDPGSALLDGLVPGDYHISLRVRDDADPAQFDVTTEVFNVNNDNQGPNAVPIPPGQIAYTGEFVPGGVDVSVTLDGTHSNDPENDPIITYAWDLDGNGTFDDAADQALGDSSSATPTLTFNVATTVEVGLMVCSQDEFDLVQCSQNQARVEIFIADFDLFVVSVSADNIVQGVSADVTVEMDSDLTASITGVQVRLFDGIPPAYGGGGVALGGVETVDFIDDGNGNFVASLTVVGLALNPGTEEVFAFLDSNTAFPEYDESQASNLGLTNVSNQPPTAVCNDINVFADANCSAVVTAEQIGLGSSDIDGDVITYSAVPAGPYAVGVHIVDLTVTDPKGETDTCQATITVTDNIVPVITLNGGDITLECGVDSYAELGASAADNCEVGNVVITGSVTDAPGVYAIAYDVSDINGNPAVTVVRTVTVQDTLPPTVFCPADVTLECNDLTDTTTANTGSATGTDICSGVTISYSDIVTPGCGGSYTITRTWTATDGVGLTDTCVQKINVGDTTAPTLAISANFLDGITPPDAPVSYIITTGDDCSDVTLALSYNSFKLKKDGTRKETGGGSSKSGSSKSGSSKSGSGSKSGSSGFSGSGAVVEIVGNVVTVVYTGGVNNHIEILATATDACGNTTSDVWELVVAKPAKGGSSKSGSSKSGSSKSGSSKGKGSKANEGVGNGVDGNTPGHGPNGGNDDPGNTPGNPGAKAKNDSGSSPAAPAPKKAPKKGKKAKKGKKGKK